MKTKIAAGILAIGLLLPVMAGAQANLDCWMEAPLQTMVTPSNTVDTITEYVVLICRNKGSQDATTTTCTFSAPQYTNPTPTTWSIGTLSVDSTISTTITLTPGDTIPAGTTLEWGLTCTYNNGSASASVDIDASTYVMPEIEHKLIKGSAGWGDYDPMGRKIVFTDWIERDLFMYDVDTGDSVQLNYDGFTYSSTSCDSKPWFSPDGSKILWQRRNECDYASIWVMNADGSNPHVVLDPGCDGECYNHPKWTPDGRIVARRDAESSPGMIETVNGIYEGDYGPMWYVVNADGSGRQRITPMRDEGWTPQADTRLGQVLLRGSWSNWYTTPDVFGFNYNVEEGEAIQHITGYGPTKMGVYRPLRNQVIYSDGFNENSVGQIFLGNTDNTNKQCLTCSKRVEEYQRSDDADSITLDYGGSNNPILRIDGVWRADAPPPLGKNYMKQDLVFGSYSNQINLPEPLDANSPSARVPVLVSYSFVDNDSDCYNKPHFSVEGNAIVYQRYEGDNGYSQYEFWLSDTTGNNRVRLTYKGAYGLFWTSGPDNFNLPMISPRGDTVLVSKGSGGLYILGLPQDARLMVKTFMGVGKKDKDDDDGPFKCGTMATGVPGIFSMLIMGLPIILGLGARSMVRRRK